MPNSNQDPQDHRLAQQYTQLYGPFVKGDYEIGDMLYFDEGAHRGVVIWSYVRSNGRTYYVVDAGHGIPLEIERREVTAQP
ncbi:MAG: hypothetical protein J2P37_00320 [Ktedonobacteraceae bacterium]|nr:hypothetical protein [Ktedonobacteraceae bacterium]